MESYQSVETPIGILRGRDAIFLDDLQFLQNELILKGSFNGNLASNTSEQWIGYIVVFSEVITFEVIELDIWIYKENPLSQWSESFVQVHNSEKVSQLKETELPQVHYIFQTYDYVVSVLCSGFQIKIVNSKVA